MIFRLLIGLVFLFYSWGSLYAEISVIPDREYFNTVQKLLASAESSIEVEMYLAYSNNLQVKELLNDIVKAKDRGVKVNILLEDGQEENKISLEYLRDRGVEAKLDDPETKLHAKMILVDGKKLVIGSSNWTRSAFSKNNESNVALDLKEDKDKIEMLRSDYAERLIKAIDNAREKIDIIIYSFQFDYNEKTKNYEVMEALLKAHDRDVRIRIVLDSWKGGQSANEPAYEVLERAGVEVYYDFDTIASHNKLIVIDNETVLLGSANWTATGLAKNREASILIRDPSTSGIYKAYIDKLIDNLPEKKEKKVPIPISFLKEDGILWRLYRKEAKKGIKFYCWFMWEAFTGDTYIVKRDFKKWYETIYGEPALPWNVSKSKRMAYVVCNLEKWGAIKRKKRGSEITLIDLADRDKWKDSECIFVPPEFWTMGWVKKLSGPGVYFYLVNLAEFKKSSYKPVWMNSQEKISKEYEISRVSISSCAKELMCYNLIEIKHDIPDPGQAFWERKANRYFINPLWSEDELELKWKKLTERHGLDLVSKARELATRINEPYDPEVVADMIMLIKIYGKEAVKEAVNIATKLAFENGKWELRYVIGILQHDMVPLNSGGH